MIKNMNYQANNAACPECKRLLECLAAAEFAYWDTHLYLDTHPDDAQALAAAREYKSKAEMLRCEYEQKCQQLKADPAAMSCRWTWVDDPWPWDVTKGV